MIHTTTVYITIIHNIDTTVYIMIIHTIDIIMYIIYNNTISYNTIPFNIQEWIIFNNTIIQYYIKTLSYNVQY